MNPSVVVGGSAAWSASPTRLKKLAVPSLLAAAKLVSAAQSEEPAFKQLARLNAPPISVTVPSVNPSPPHFVYQGVFPKAQLPTPQGVEETEIEKRAKGVIDNLLAGALGFLFGGAASFILKGAPYRISINELTIEQKNPGAGQLGVITHREVKELAPDALKWAESVNHILLAYVMLYNSANKVLHLPKWFRRRLEKNIADAISPKNEVGQSTVPIPYFYAIRVARKGFGIFTKTELEVQLIRTSHLDSFLGTTIAQQLATKPGQAPYLNRQEALETVFNDTYRYLIKHGSQRVPHQGEVIEGNDIRERFLAIVFAAIQEFGVGTVESLGSQPVLISGKIERLLSAVNRRLALRYRAREKQLPIPLEDDLATAPVCGFMFLEVPEVHGSKEHVKERRSGNTAPSQTGKTAEETHAFSA